MPCAVAIDVKVAITSSASYPSTWTKGMRSAPRISWTSEICPSNSLGVADRPALYSA